MGGLVPVGTEAQEANPGSRWLRISSCGRENPPTGTAQADRAGTATEEVVLPIYERSRSLARDRFSRANRVIGRRISASGSLKPRRITHLCCAGGAPTCGGERVGLCRVRAQTVVIGSRSWQSKRKTKIKRQDNGIIALWLTM